ncbi:acyl carrier protein [Desulfocurvibacter africanus]|uniref:Acyl carrier protein n=2 Tax=Desulfocurvibacter africanus TaxID=873 RepID=F3YZB4_DESAF|nr:acyl carrier protein [Desulfocurvibacter africanus]EGJ51943.1 Acyl carrier protein [Desulfocurvibacter africanus subsp. africanus str. Walvis Bay]EMG38301.1 acyl carrier protein [Desulfocurvibacter africanus PCS]
MTDQEVIAIVNKALAEEFELDEAVMVPEANLYQDLELDSLDAVDMVIVLENAFGCKLRDEEAIRSIRTLSDLYKFILKKKEGVTA